ncbi:hypothetical protein GW756_05450 [bacterium]|nr:hypothetical protein [bacterium]NCQ55329.1 hypothetical protein [Candidatus Parcubacteria bacterium]NCS67158.1 hypothetical protein [Candidatus Peregrinibacteria bacterium]NCS96784.1 hypothetical protein [bacterium]
MLEQFEAALRVSEWPKIKTPPRVLDFLKGNEVDIPGLGPDRESLQRHFSLNFLQQDLPDILFKSHMSAAGRGLIVFRDQVSLRSKRVLSFLDWPEGWNHPHINPMDAGVENAIEANIDLGLLIMTNLYTRMLLAYSDANKEPNFKAIETACLKVARKVMQLAGENDTVRDIESILGCFDDRNTPVFELNAAQNIDVTTQTRCQLMSVMNRDMEIMNLLALEKCPAFYHGFINQYTKTMTQVAIESQTTDSVGVLPQSV